MQLIKEADALISTVNAVNSSLLNGRRTQAIAKIDIHIAALTKDVAAAQGDANLRATCLRSLGGPTGASAERRKPRPHYAGRE